MRHETSKLVVMGIQHIDDDLTYTVQSGKDTIDGSLKLLITLHVLELIVRLLTSHLYL